jgi:hypothetical protein
MSANKYRGDSPQKEIARDWAYSNLSKKEIREKAHVILPSEFCGDVEVLKSLGCAPYNIMCADLNPAAVTEAKKRGCQAWFCYVEELVKTIVDSGQADNLAGVNADYCHRIHNAVVSFNFLLETLHSVHWSGYMFLTFTRGFKDGYHSDSERIAYLNKTVYRTNKRAIVFSPESLCRYQSNTEVSVGSPMALIVMRVGKGKITCIPVPK